METKKYEPELKAKIALEAIKNQKSTAEICSEYKIPSTNLYDWRDRVLARLKDLFVEESESARKQRILAQEIESLHKVIGELTVENSYLKKITEISKKDRVRFIEKDSDLSIRKHADLLGICRSSLYYRPIINNESEVANLIQEVYLASDCRYGYRKITAEIIASGVVVNRKKILRIMKKMKISGLYCRKRCNTSIKEKKHKIYPYLLKDLIICRVNQVWATDITYIMVEGKFVYFVAIMDLYSRYIIAHSLSPYLDAGFCLYTLKEALKQGKHEIFNSDQGVQFTCYNFITELEHANIKISMDHKGRCFDNIFVERLWRTLKQEAIYYYRPNSIRDLNLIINDFVGWYNYRRLHQTLNYKVPADLYYHKQ
ncbi:IS3 family transposase [Wolbachia endosymbiont of Frankliniella intonsa]|nr:IS3 family transposase [Wolbachia endosymbiont of Frankliniella intonsa]WGJ62630.1 IS3 family transposase [Wolbachia endosymbiont of Frankliniella intonsa]